ncbi:hypothetical protein ACU8KH_01615 [Lachancea thermotolerans]
MNSIPAPNFPDTTKNNVVDVWEYQISSQGVGRRIGCSGSGVEAIKKHLLLTSNIGKQLL